MVQVSDVCGRAGSLRSTFNDTPPAVQMDIVLTERRIAGRGRFDEKAIMAMVERDLERLGVRNDVLNLAGQNADKAEMILHAIQTGWAAEDPARQSYLLSHVVMHGPEGPVRQRALETFEGVIEDWSGKDLRAALKRVGGLVYMEGDKNGLTPLSTRLFHGLLERLIDIRPDRDYADSAPDTGEAVARLGNNRMQACFEAVDRLAHAMYMAHPEEGGVSEFERQSIPLLRKILDDMRGSDTRAYFRAYAHASLSAVRSDVLANELQKMAESGSLLETAIKDPTEFTRVFFHEKRLYNASSCRPLFLKIRELGQGIGSNFAPH